MLDNRQSDSGPPLPTPSPSLSPSRGIHSDSQETTATFTKFLLLPENVRRRIWKDFAKQPRDVEVVFSLKDWWSRCPPSEKIPRFTSISPIPAILHTCSESRNEGLKIFKKCFNIEVEEWQDVDDSGSESFRDSDPESEEDYRPVKKRKTVSSKGTKDERCIYINPEIDTLFVAFPDWAFYHWQPIKEVFVYDGELDNAPQRADFNSTVSTFLNSKYLFIKYR
jgi:hypothetical protein